MSVMLCSHRPLSNVSKYDCCIRFSFTKLYSSHGENRKATNGNKITLFPWHFSYREVAQSASQRIKPTKKRHTWSLKGHGQARRHEMRKKPPLEGPPTLREVMIHDHGQCRHGNHLTQADRRLHTKSQSGSRLAQHCLPASDCCR